jgi:serine protease Do
MFYGLKSKATDAAQFTGAVRLLTGAALLLSMVAVPAPAAERATPNQMLNMGRNLTPLVVRVHSRTAEGRMNVGSGVAVGNNLVATNCHVTRRANTIQVIANGFEGPMPYRAVAQASSTGKDVCVLRLEQRLALPPVRMSQGTVKIDDPVIAIGFTGGTQIRLHVGAVKKLHALEGSQILETSTAFDQGASGGALFSSDGELLGLITFRSQFNDLRYFSTPAQWIVELIESAPFEPIAPLAGRAFWEETGARLPDFLRGQLSPKEDRTDETIRLPQFERDREAAR